MTSDNPFAAADQFVLNPEIRETVDSVDAVESTPETTPEINKAFKNFQNIPIEIPSSYSCAGWLFLLALVGLALTAWTVVYIILIVLDTFLFLFAGNPGAILTFLGLVCLFLGALINFFLHVLIYFSAKVSRSRKTHVMLFAVPLAITAFYICNQFPLTEPAQWSLLAEVAFFSFGGYGMWVFVMSMPDDYKGPLDFMLPLKPYKKEKPLVFNNYVRSPLNA